MDKRLGLLVFAVILGGPVAVCAEDSPRVRGSSPETARAIAEGAEKSATFRQLVATIAATDGIVYVHHDTCGRNVRACLVLGVTYAGSHRVLHIRVDKRKRGDDLLVSIGHELHHAAEVLADPNVVDTNSIRRFYELLAPTNRYSFETQAAIKTGLKIAGELRAWRKQQRAP
jgi:hypothetical protein